MPPGNHLEFGESFKNCAIREVAQETGIEIQNLEFFAITNDIFQLEQKHYISIFTKVTYTANQEVKKSRTTQNYGMEMVFDG